MNTAVFNRVPLWLVFVATVAFILLSIEAGFRVGLVNARRSEDAREASIDPLVGSTLGLLAFVLASENASAIVKVAIMFGDPAHRRSRPAAGGVPQSEPATDARTAGEAERSFAASIHIVGPQ